MNKEFVKYNQALALKELGFDEDCFGFYNLTITKTVIMNNNSYGGFGLTQDHIIAAPLYQQAFRWFREKYDYAGFIQLVEPEYGGDYGYVIYYKLNHLAVDHWNKGFNTYEEAEQACLDKLIELVKNG